MKSRFRTFARSISAIIMAMIATQAMAIPAFSRMYNVACSTCHSVAPHLNRTGMAFQANFFRWTSEGGSSIARQRGLLAVPLSVIGTADTVRNSSLATTSPFRSESLELYASDSFALDARRNGGYFIDVVAAEREARGGDLEDAFAAFPVLGRNGQLALTVGQSSPMMYQYDPLNSLTSSLPVGLSQGTDGVAFTDPVPIVRLDYFDNRGKGTADGNYLTAGLTFKDHLTLNKDSRLNGPRGVIVHGFRRQGGYSLGAFGYANGKRQQYGLLATGEALPRLYLLAAAATARDIIDGSTLHNRGLSLEADYAATTSLALTGRLDSVSGDQKDTYPVAAITYYPLPLSVLRISAETVQQKGNRQLSLVTYLQF